MRPQEMQRLGPKGAGPFCFCGQARTSTLLLKPRRTGRASGFFRALCGIFLMPNAAPRPCTFPGCGALVRDGRSRCQAHRQQERREQDARRGSAHKRGYNYRWKKAREDFLKRNPLCTCDECTALGRVLPADTVDHRVPHRGDERLMWDESNWQAMNHDCHSRKTAAQDGGFGNVPRGTPRETPRG